MTFVKFLPFVLMAFAKAVGAVHFNQDPRRKLTPSMNCHKYFVETHGEKATTADHVSLRQQPQQPSTGSKACHHKLSKSREGLKVEMSVCLDPFSNSLRGLPNQSHQSNSKSRTGTNGFSHHTATATRNINNENNNNNLVYYLDNRQLQELLQLDDTQLQELLQQKTISETNAVFVVVDCKIDKDEAHKHPRHLHQLDKETIKHHRHLHQQNTSNHHRHEKSYLFYFVATVLVAFFISRLRVHVDVRLDVGGAGEQGALVIAQNRQPPEEPIVMADAIVINAEEQHAVLVYG